jgi:hypothetical protein
MAAQRIAFCCVVKIAVPGAGIREWQDIDRLDVRPGKGVVKVRTENHWELQIDPTKFIRRKLMLTIIKMLVVTGLVTIIASLAGAEVFSEAAKLGANVGAMQYCADHAQGNRSRWFHCF